jgi:hypothetical protein
VPEPATVPDGAAVPDADGPTHSHGFRVIPFEEQLAALRN